MRLWEPALERVLLSVPALGVRRLAVLPLAPFSVHVYADAAERSLATVRGELGERAPSLVHVAPYGNLPSFIDAHAARIQKTLAAAGAKEETALVLTAHSLPTAVITAGDPYVQQVEACAAAIGVRLYRAFELAYQSQGADGEWLGPDLRSVMQRLRTAGVRRVALAPIGFLAEHVETLYDLDIEARGFGADLGLDVLRVPALDDDPKLVTALAEVAEAALAQP
jgi:ferrochelatase